MIEWLLNGSGLGSWNMVYLVTTSSFELFFLELCSWKLNIPQAYSHMSDGLF